MSKSSGPGRKGLRSSGGLWYIRNKDFTLLWWFLVLYKLLGVISVCLWYYFLTGCSFVVSFYSCKIIFGNVSKLFHNVSI